MPRNDYPQGAVNNAKRALKWADENGWGSCGTEVGKQRANQIASRENLSDETIKRTYSYLSRAANNADVPYSEGCGGLMYDAWGGKAMLRWAAARVDEMNERNMDGAVRRALRSMTREHNQNNPDNKTTQVALGMIYETLPGEPKDRIRGIRSYLAGEPQEQQRKAQADGVQFRHAEMRAATDDLVVEGYAAVFNSTTDLGTFQERIAPGAFADVLEDDVRLLINHDGVPLARTSNGTLTLKEDEEGLYYRGVLSDTQAGRDLYTMIQRGDISQSSFAFTIGEESVDEDGVRVIEKVSRLIDVSPVTYPAYQAASVYARAEEKKEND
jgi:uncharacterized protein